MSGPAVIFRELHRLRKHAKDLQDQLERGPRLIQGQHAKAARQEDAYREAQETLKRLKVAMHDHEVTLKATHGLIAKHQKQLNEAGGSKEYAALQSEIAAERKRGQELEDAILEGMAAADEQAAKLPEIEAAVRKAKEEAAQYEQTARQRLAGFAEQLEVARKQIAETEAGLSEEVRPLYDRLVTARGEDGMAVVQGRNCVACNTSITAQNYNDLLAERLVFCKACGRVLYLPE
jgi:predicted  nucleic acid-binding Zn-ribbon protein